MIKKGLICLIGVFLLAFPAKIMAQCDCDHIIKPSQWYVDGKAIGVKPGDKVCFQNGTRERIELINMTGTAANPVVITNMCDGKVTFRGATITAPFSVHIYESSFFRFTGSGNSGVDYGIEMTNSHMGLDIQRLSTNFEVDHVKATNLGSVAFVGKTDPTCDTKTWRGNFVMRNVKFHDNYVDASADEGFYVGNSHYSNGVTKTCNGSNIKIYEHDVVGVDVYNNIVLNTGRDGIQVGSATSGCKIYNNRIENFATRALYGHQSGIQINEGTVANIYNNRIIKGTGFGIFVSGSGGTRVANNLITDAAQGGIFANDFPPYYSNVSYTFINNTLVNNRDYGIYMLSLHTVNNVFADNLIVAPSQSGFQYVKLNSGSISWTEKNNTKTTDINSIKFVNVAAKDYHLQSTSPAVNTGFNTAPYGVTSDLEGTPRPSGGVYDIGAYEFKSGGNSAPVANAGSDKAITLPVNSTALPGSGTDSDGTIASYSWTKKSGGAATLTNANTASLALSGLVAGTYVFTLKVTDNAGATGTDDVTLTVNAASSAPVANAGADKSIALPTTSTSFAGSGTDTGGSISSYLWTKKSGGAATLANTTTATLSVSGLVAGTYVFTLKVTDNSGLTGSDDVTLTVNAASSAPVANAGADKTITLPTNSTSFAGSGTDAGGSIASYLWTKKSGGAATLANTTSGTLGVSGLVAGSYVFTLKVTDNAGLTATDDVTLTVNPSGNAAPVANAGPDKSTTMPTNWTTFSGTGTDSNGTIASYLWSKKSGGTVMLANKTTARLGVSGLVVGTYVFTLKVTDNNGATATDDVTLVVNGAAAAPPPAPPASATIAQFNFTNTAQSVAGWTNVAGSPHASVITVTDAATSYTVSSVSTGQWNPANFGTLSSSYSGGATNGTVQPAAVVQTNWFNYNAPYGTVIGGVSQGDNIRLSNLNPSHKYTLQMGASRRTDGMAESDQYGHFEFRINGANPKTLNPTDNVSNQVEYVSIQPNAAGQIGISARKLSGSAMNYGYIGWLVVTDVTVNATTTTFAATDSTGVIEEEAGMAANEFSSEEEFVFLNDSYPGGHDYQVMVFNASGKKIYSGEWASEMYYDVFREGGFYIYHIIQDGADIYTGKTFVTK